MDWTKIGDETVELLRRYLRIDTTNPPGNEAAGTRFLAEVLTATTSRARPPSRRRGGATSSRASRATARSAASCCTTTSTSSTPIAATGPSTPSAASSGTGTLRARRARHEVHRHPAARGRAGHQARAGSAQARSRSSWRTADEEAGSGFGARFVADKHRDWLAGAEYALSELGRHRAATPARRAPLGAIVISEKTGLPLRLTARERARPRLDALARHRAAPAGPRARPAAGGRAAAARAARGRRSTSRAWPRSCRRARAPGYDDLERSLRDPAFRARFLADRYRAAHGADDLRREHARGQREAQRDPAGGGRRHRLPDAGGGRPRGDPGLGARRHRRRARRGQRRARAQAAEPLAARHRALQGAGRLAAPPRARRGGGARDPGRLHRQLGVPRAAACTATAGARSCSTRTEWRRIHGNDERISLENIRAGVRAYTEMLLAVAAA